MVRPRRPRLLVLASTYPRWQGDPEPGFVHELAKRLVADFDVTVLGPHAPGASPLELMDGVRIVRYRYAPARFESLVNDGGITTNLRKHPWKWLLLPTFLLGLFGTAWRLLRSERPDVIHAHWLLPQGLVVAMLGAFVGRETPFLVTSHGADLFALRAAPLQALKRFVVERAAAVTVVSAPMREVLERIAGGSSHAEVQPMGVDLQTRFTPGPETRASDRLLFVGRLVEKKGLRYLIEALPRVRQRFPGISLDIAGFGPEEAALRQQVQALDLGAVVRFLGAVQQDALPPLYRSATALVAPFIEARGGDQEGLGLVLVEALGCGCPVVTTRIPAVREVFAGEWPDFAAIPASAPSLADEICRVLENPEAARSAVDANAAALRARFDWSRVAAEYRRILMGIRRAAP